MPPDRLQSILPPLHETHHSRESLVRALREEDALPEGAVAAAAAYAEHIAADVVSMLERACVEDLDEKSGNLLFRGLHILGGRRQPAIFQPLIRFLRGPQERVDELLGDAIAETLTGILAGSFDGDVAALCGLVEDVDVDPFVRDAALQALVLLNFDGRIDRRTVEAFLRTLDANGLIPLSDKVMWHAWMSAVAVLGAEPLAPAVRAAFADGRISPEFCDEEDFDHLLAQALARPRDRSRLTEEHIGYIDDVVGTLQRFHYSADDRGGKKPETSRELAVMPHHNPFRGVGRNDPCPCGSGRKAKKCCLR
jgi:hypothetical protein